MRRTTAAATLLLIATLGCNTDHPSSPSSPQLAKGGNGKPDNGDDVTDLPVSATFRDDAGDGVLSDDQGTYQGDNVYIRDNGNLFFDVREDIPRQICFDFGNQGYEPALSCDDGYITTKDADIEGGMQGMAVGDVMTTRALVYWSVPDEARPNKSSARYLRFGIDCDYVEVPSNRIVVAHPDTSTWTLEGETGFLCQGTTVGKPEIFEVGEFEMPFKLTLVKVEP